MKNNLPFIKFDSVSVEIPIFHGEYFSLRTFIKK